LMTRIATKLGVAFGKAVKPPHIPLRDLRPGLVGSRGAASIAGSTTRPPDGETRAGEASAQPTGTSVGDVSSS
jgi:hypothetical protein